MVWWCKIMFDLVLTMSVGVLLRLGGAVKTVQKSKSLSELKKKIHKKLFLPWQLYKNFSKKFQI